MKLFKFTDRAKLRKKYEQTKLCNELGSELRDKLLECRGILEEYKLARAKLEAMK